MSKKFQKQYRVQSARMQNYDYGQNGAYFVTICTKNKKNYFGDVVDDEMRLSEIGEIVNDEWQKTQEIRKNVVLDKWIVMPNHFHAIINIVNPVETHCNASLQSKSDFCVNKFGPQRNNLSSIIRGFKGSVTKRAHLSGYDDFAWQS